MYVRMYVHVLAICSGTYYVHVHVCMGLTVDHYIHTYLTTSDYEVIIVTGDS